MRINAYRALRISLAAAMLLLFAEIGFTAQTYRVRSGDTMYSIATKHGVSATALLRANGLKSASIKPGQTLSVPSNQRTSSEPVVYGVSTRQGLDFESSGKVVKSLDKGEKFTVIARQGSKFNVKLSDGRVGSVRADAVSLEDTRKPTAMGDTWGLKRSSSVVQMALSYRGSRYVRGGSSPGAFDCSGFVKYLYAKVGIKLPHDSRGQFQYGKYVSKDQLQAGDVLFFVNTYRRGISHVGVYVGDGQFVHASTSRGGVKLSSLSEAYYAHHYFGAKRLQ